MWKPGAARERRELEDPYFDVPDHLRRPLWGWVENTLSSDRYMAVAMALRVDVDTDYYAMPYALQQLEMGPHPDILLDTIETLLELYGPDGGRSDQLGAILELGNSAYAVREDHRGLEERVVHGVQSLVSEVAQTATGSAGDHLVAAWNAAYGRSSDSVKAYSEAVKAAEAALAPLVSPQNAKQTLGTMIKDLGNKPSKWSFVIADGTTSNVGTVLGMMRTLWEGQTSRHGGANPTRAETLEEARAGLHLAAALVQFGISRAIDTV